jgi:hypothetical protein
MLGLRSPGMICGGKIRGAGKVLRGLGAQMRGSGTTVCQQERERATIQKSAEFAGGGGDATS